METNEFAVFDVKRKAIQELLEKAGLKNVVVGFSSCCDNYIRANISATVFGERPYQTDTQEN